MRIYSPKTVAELKRLRRMGFSINELVGKLSIPRTSVWHHVHDVKISEKYLPILESKRGGSHRRVEKRWVQARSRAQLLLKGQHRELILLFAMLYWAEGSKRACEFINSDGTMIQLYLKILREVFSIHNSSIKPTMRIFNGMNREECLAYWSGITRIPKQNFVVRLNDGGKSGKTKFGMCRITILKGADTLKLFHSLIDEIIKEFLGKQNSHAPIVQGIRTVPS